MPGVNGAASTAGASILLCAAVLALAGCATVVRVPLEKRPALPLPEEALTLTRPGPGAFTVQPGEFRGVSGCRVACEVYSPAEPRTGVLVVLAHGFFRDLRRMRGWASLWASHGVRTAVLSFCASTPFAGNHDKNAADMRRLAAALTDGAVLYAGFSAGGLAAFLAAADDPRAVGCLGLDTVDSGGLASPAAARFDAPALFILSEPSDCNAGNNVIPSIPRRAGIGVLRVRNARHSHFEDPYDPCFESICGSVRPVKVSEDIILTVRAVATAWLLERCGVLGPGQEPPWGASGKISPWTERLEVLKAP
jgi:pimeloyl-ACP methyl ester carboxylesterase